MPSSDAAVQQTISAALARATGLALQADSAAAAAELAQLDPAMLDGEAAAFRDCMIQRFGPDSTAPRESHLDDPWLADLVNAFLTYWHQALTKRQSLEAAEDELQGVLGELVGGAHENLEEQIQAEITKRGLYALMGRTLPLLDLMLWRSQGVAQVEVQLPERAHAMTATYLDDFVLRGWGHFATCGRRSTGGWANTAGLFAVAPAYKRLDDETFTVRFLAHEAQHSIDMQTWANLESWQLEYRAKLTEVALAQTTQQETLRRLCENRSDATRDAPHAYANFLVIRNLEQRLSGFDLCGGMVSDEAAVREAARALLVEDSRNRAMASE